MSLEERMYSVLIISASDNFNTALKELLPDSVFSPVQIVPNINSAKRAFSGRSFDFLFINSPLSDDPGIRFSIDCSNRNDTVILLLVRNDIHDEIYAKVLPYGIFTLPKPTSKSTLYQAVNWMRSERERLRKLEKKTLTIEEKMEEIRVVNRAKWILIHELKMEEPQAHRYIEKQAMDCCTSKRSVAEKIIKLYT